MAEYRRTRAIACESEFDRLCVLDLRDEWQAEIERLRAELAERTRQHKVQLENVWQLAENIAAARPMLDEISVAFVTLGWHVARDRVREIVRTLERTDGPA